MPPAGPEGEGPLRRDGDGVLVHVRLQPRARRNRVEGVGRDETGAAVLRAAVTAPPAKGQANAALTALLAEFLGIAKSEVALVRGAAQRRKTFRVADPDGTRLAAFRRRVVALPHD